MVMAMMVAMTLVMPMMVANCEAVWAQVQLAGCKTLTIGSLYRTPDKKDMVTMAMMMVMTW